MHGDAAQQAGNARERHPHGRPSRPWTVRTASWAARHRWPVFGGWLVLTLGLFVVSLAAGGIRAASATSGAELLQSESGRAVLAMRNGGVASAPDELDVVITHPARRATDPDFHATVEAVVERLASITTETGGSTLPAATGITDPYSAPAVAGLVAPDGAAVRIVGRIEGDQAAIEARTRAVDAALASLRAGYPGYEIHAYANTLLADQMSQEINRDLDGALRITVPATFLILLVAFGALVAACVPLVLATTALLGAFGIVGLFSQLVEPVSAYATQVIVLIGFAVAIDYSLFMITRFRTERRAGRPGPAAIEAATATAGRAVFFSGMAVMVSLAGLFLLPVAVFQTMAIGCIAVIFVSVLGSILFLPAVLALAGDGIDRGAIPFLGRGRLEDAALWRRIVSAVMARPIVAAVAATTILVVLASPIVRIRLGEPDITIVPESVDGVRAVEVIRQHWPQGALVTLDVAVTRADEPATQWAIQALAARLLRVDGLSGPERITTSNDGSTANVSVLMAGTANDPASWRIVEDVRAAIVPAVIAGLPGVQAFVGGAAAASLDQTRIYTDGMARILVFVLGLSFVLLLLVFHSIAIPVKAIALNLLATGAAFGALVLVFQEGWFAASLGIVPGEITNFIPIFVFTTLFGLSMDYEVFILTRIMEAWRDGADSREAVATGISLTAGTVTSAAAIMVVVFAVFVTLPLGIARQLGLGLAVAVFVDATLIRMVLLPASMRLLGDWNWWMPAFLRWLPRITIEGGTGRTVDELAILPSGTGAAAR